MATPPGPSIRRSRPSAPPQGIPVGTRFTTSQQPAVIGGNPDLRAETAATATVGVVIEPRPLPGVTLSQVIHGVGFYDLGVYPREKANLSSHWTHPGGASGGFTLRYVGAYRECAGDDCNTPHNLAAASREVDRYVKLDLFGGYDLPSSLGKTSVQIGVNNAFDAAPPVVHNAPAANSDATTHDFLGRMVYLRLSQRFQ